MSSSSSWTKSSISSWFFFISSHSLFCMASSVSSLARRPEEIILPMSSFSCSSCRHLAISLLPVAESGVNFHADSSSWVSCAFFLVSSSSFLSLCTRTFTAGSSSVERSCPEVGV